MNRPSAPRSTRLGSVLSPSLAGTLLALALGAGIGGGCMLSVEAEMPDVEITQHDIAFEGVPNGASLGELSTGMSFTQEHPAVDFPKGVDSSVAAVSIDLIAKTGIQNFNFLRALRITMTPQGGTEPIELINYEKVDGAVAGATLTMPSKNPLNILEQWRADSAVFDLQIAGTLPEQAWSIDMSVHFAGKVSYKY